MNGGDKEDVSECTMLLKIDISFMPIPALPTRLPHFPILWMGTLRLQSNSASQLFGTGTHFLERQSARDPPEVMVLTSE